MIGQSSFSSFGLVTEILLRSVVSSPCPYRSHGAVSREISTQVTVCAHAAVILDPAGWHTAHDLDLPDNIPLLLLPPYPPELKPIENLIQFLRRNFLNARVYDTYEDIVDVCCWAWTSLLNIDRRLRGITTRSCAKTVNL